MVNSYCESLKDTFAELVYYGILKEEDAQCFSVRSTVEPGSFVLAAGAVLLALVNTFVMKAVVQYFRDQDELEKRALLDEENTSHIEDSSKAEDVIEAGIHPVPVLFTDTFRWLLRREGSLVSSSRGFVPDSYKSMLASPQEATVAYSTHSFQSMGTEDEQFVPEDEKTTVKEPVASALSFVDDLSEERRVEVTAYQDEEIMDDQGSDRDTTQFQPLDGTVGFEQDEVKSASLVEEAVRDARLPRHYH
jgi:hypothetical protein